MQFEITIKKDGAENTRRFRFETNDEAYNADWNEKVQSIIEDLQEYIDTKDDL